MSLDDRTGQHECRLVAQMNALTNKALVDPWLKARYVDLGATPLPTSPAEIKAFRDRVRAEG